MQGPLRRQLRQAPLRASPQVLDVPDGEDGQLKKVTDQVSERCTDMGILEPVLNQGEKNYLGLISRVG